MNNIIFLIGMPGAGKTWWGRKLQQSYALPFWDLDEYIERKEGLTIRGVFESIGEGGFRTKESASFKELVQKTNKPFVLSCGGGTPLNPVNFGLMKENGCVIYLKAELSTLMTNLQKEPAKRPLLNDEELKQRLEQLHEERHAIYEQADYILQVEGLTASRFAPIISSCIEKQ